MRKYVTQIVNSKPSVIICSETRSLDYPKFYQLHDNTIFYNKSKINISDGVIMYIRNDFQHSIEIFEHDKVKILTATISIKIKLT